MGSFNTTCCVSQQTIASYDSVYLFPIEQQHSYEKVSLINNATGKSVKEDKYSFTKNTCYPNGLWETSGPMIEGVYDDYGRFKLANNKDNVTNLHNLFKHLSTNGLITEANARDGGFDMKEVFDKKKQYSYLELTDIWEYMFTACEQERVFVNDYKGVSSPFTFAVMHKATGKYLINMIENSDSWHSKPTTQKKSLVQYISEQIDGSSFFKESLPIDVCSRVVASQMTHLQDFQVVNNSYAKINKFYEVSIKGSTFPQLLQPYLESPTKMKVEKDIVDQFYQLVKSQLNHRYILGGMDELNAKLSPMIYAGQDYSNKVGNEVLKMITTVNAQVTKQIKQRNAENGDEYEEEVAPVVAKKNKLK